MTGAPIRVGLLGCGWIAEVAHVPTLLRSPVAVIAAAADGEPARRAWLASRAPAARLFDSWHELIDDGSVDAVLIALPTALHAEAAAAAFAAGKHVFLEKPIALTMADARRVIDSRRGAGTVGAIGFNFRRNPNAVRAANALADGSLGDLVAIQASFQWAAPELQGWRAEPERGGGALIDLVSHHVDLILALTGRRPVEAQCRLRTVRSPEDAAAVQLTMEGGLVAQLQASSAAGSPVNQLDLIGRNGRIRADLLESIPAKIERKPGPGARLHRAVDALAALHPGRLLRSPGAEPSFGATLEAFLAAIRSGSPATPDLFDGLRALAVVDAATRSARQGGQPVAVEPIG